ncbi:MAG: (E)-4-hydroxy-3-methylbut-2-enyl-diphosphate synthase [Bacteroidales bacterium]|nr:(E)-4-hydroxy-3-methylbut-2-enyl-diphosphate synthase [Bacteroidales bacterium]
MEYLSCKIGDVTIGHGHPIAVQSMCNTDTLDVDASVAQCEALSRAGCEIIRLTTQGLRQVEALAQIKERLRTEGVGTPLVADVHFNADVAIAAARVAEKVRINPGNFSKDPEVARAKFAALTDVCRQTGCAIRIGLNHGSLGERITAAYGDTPLGMVRAVMEWLQMAVELDFLNITVSLKSSNTKVMADAYRLLYKTMGKELGMIFPLHVGVTEAGAGDTGRIKSVVGIGTLLREGIGDTIRVSLTEDPVCEVPVAQKLRALAATETPAPDATSFSIDASNHDDFIIRGAYLAGPALLDGRIDDFTMRAKVAGRELPAAEIEAFKDDLMQACRRRFTKPEYIACPGCGRTLYDIQSLLKEVMEATSEFVGVKIAVMGCIVNGPGEMADADFGYVGEGGGKVTLYRGGTTVMRGIPQEEGVAKLVKLINETLDR